MGFPCHTVYDKSNRLGSLALQDINAKIDEESHSVKTKCKNREKTDEEIYLDVLRNLVK